MKKIVLLLFTHFTFAQVGINTTNPQATLEINSNSSIPLLELVKDSDTKVIVTNSGNIGVNNSSPDNKLVINNGTASNTGLTLTTGAGNGYKLVSDDKGNAIWDARSVEVIFADKDADVKTDGVNILNLGSVYYTGSSITLSPGRWAVSIGIFSSLGTIDANGTGLTDIVANTSNYSNVIDTDSSIWCSCYLSSSKNAASSLGSNFFIGNSGKAVASSLGRGMNRMVMEGNVLLSISSQITIYLNIKCNNMGVTTTKRPAQVNSDAWETWFYATPI